MCFELLKVLFVQIFFFLISLPLCIVVVNLLQANLSKLNYKLSKEFYNILTCILITVLGIAIGRIIVIRLI
jgi:hypothetical protein